MKSIHIYLNYITYFILQLKCKKYQKHENISIFQLIHVRHIFYFQSQVSLNLFLVKINGLYFFFRTSTLNLFY